MDCPVPTPRPGTPSAARPTADALVRDVRAALAEVEQHRRADGWTADTHTAGWSALAATGLFTTCLPAAQGGLGLDETALVQALEQVGRTGLPCPVTVTSAAAVPLVGHDLGDALVASDLGGPAVPCAVGAALFLLRHDSGLHLVRAEDVLVTLDDPTAGPHLPAQADFVPRTDTLLTDDPEMIDGLFDRGVLGSAAELVGVTARLAELLDAPPMVCDAVAKARLMTRRAAHLMAARDPGSGREVSLAKITANDTARAVGRLHEAAPAAAAEPHLLGLLSTRMWDLTRTFGDTLFHRRRFDRSVLTDPGSLLF